MSTKPTDAGSPREPMDLLSSYFLGPKAQNARLWQDMLGRVYDDYVHWRRNYFPDDPSFIGRNGPREEAQLDWLDELSSDLDTVLDKLKADYPFYSPRYIAHMLSDQTLPSVLGLFAGILYNANNVTGEAAPVTVRLELQAASKIARMLGFDAPVESDATPDQPPELAWGHLTSGGTIATLEALWVARQTQFLPLIVAHLCERKDVRDRVAERLSKRGQPLTEKIAEEIESTDWNGFLDEEIDNHLAGSERRMSDRLSLGPERALPLLWKLREHLQQRPPDDVADGTSRQFTDFILEALRTSPYNPARAGYASALAKVNRASKTKLRKGVVFASEAAHYCLAKTCNVLGYGSDGLKLIPLDEGFHMNVEELEERLAKLNAKKKYVAAVVAVLGTTEEGAVDPVEQILALRKRHAGSFWLHADAAWGGYVASVLDRDEEGALARTPSSDNPTRRSCELTVNCGKGLARPLWTKRHLPPGANRNQYVMWGVPDGGQDHVLRAFGALYNCDSAVVDPHKLGYVPYPSGTVVFRDGRTRLLSTQTASYIGTGKADGHDPLASSPAASPPSVGAYSLEGSKPGATATAAWLAHTSIPLTACSHGRIVGQTLLSAQKLADLLDGDGEGAGLAVTKGDCEGLAPYGIGFRVLCRPDTNLVTFIARPMRASKAGVRTSVRWTLPELNALNRAIHARMGAPKRTEEVKTALPADATPPYGHPFFVSRTQMVSSTQPNGTYSFASVRALLESLLDTRHSTAKQAYDQQPDGLIALRCTVMSPYYELAEASETDYIVDFVATLDKVANDVLKRFERLASYALVEVEPGKARAVANAIEGQSTSVRRALVVKEQADGHEKVLVEVRAALDREDDLPGEIRQLGADYAVDGAVHTETFIRTEGDLTGEPAIDSEPVVFVLLAVEVGRTLDVYEHIKGLSIPEGGLEVRIITGRYDVAGCLSGMGRAAARRVVKAITSEPGVQQMLAGRPKEILWVVNGS